MSKRYEIEPEYLNLKELVARMGELVGEFVKNAPIFQGDMELARELGKTLGHLQGRIEDSGYGRHKE